MLFEKSVTFFAHYIARGVKLHFAAHVLNMRERGLAHKPQLHQTARAHNYAFFGCFQRFRGRMRNFKPWRERVHTRAAQFAEFFVSAGNYLGKRVGFHSGYHSCLVLSTSSIFTLSVLGSNGFSMKAGMLDTDMNRSRV